jgi:hypothetical protein
MRSTVVIVPPRGKLLIVHPFSVSLSDIDKISQDFFGGISRSRGHLFFVPIPIRVKIISVYRPAAVVSRKIIPAYPS